MPGKTLGTLTVLIGASTSLFQRELEKSQQLTEKWSKSVRGGIGGALSKVDNDLGRFSKSIDRAFRDPVSTVTDFVDSIKIVGPAIKTAAVGVGAFAASFGLVTGAGIAAGQAFRTLSEDIQFTSDVAERLGVSFEFLRGLEGAAASFGVNAGQLNDNLRQMTTFLTSTKLSLDAGATSAGVFGQAVETIGLDVQTLFDLEPEARLLAIVEGMSQIEDETTRAGVAVRIFGESGRDLVSLAENGAAGLEQVIGQFNQLGAALSDQELQKIENARQALFDVGLVVEGLVQQFLASFAPIFETLAEFLLQSGITGAGVKDAMDAMALNVALAIGTIDSIVVAGFNTWQRFVGVVEIAAGNILKVMAGFQRGVGGILSAIANTLIRAANFIGQAIADVMNGAINQINNAISLANAVPGVSISPLGSVSAPRIGGTISAPSFNAAADEAQAQAFIFGGQSRIAAAASNQSTFVDDFITNQNALPTPRSTRGGVGAGAGATGGGGGGGGSRGGGRGGAASQETEKALKRSETLVRELARAFAEAQERVENLSQSFNDDLRATLESNEAEQFRLELLEQGAMRIDEQVRRFEELRSARDEFATSEQELGQLLMGGLITQEQYGDAIARITQEYEGLQQAFAESDLIAQEQDRVRAVADLTDSLNEALRNQLGINERLTEVERLRLEIRQLDVELTEKQIVSLEKLAATVDLTAQRTAELEAQYSLLGEASDIFLQAGQNLFSELITGTGSLGDKLGNFFNSLFDNLLQLSLNTVFQSLLGGGGGSGGFLGGIFGGLLGFQSGGYVPSDGIYQLHSGERVLNRQEVSQMRGRREGGNIIVNNYSNANVSTRMSSSGDREIIIREAVEQARTAVRNDFTRSTSSGYGSYNDGIQGNFQVRRKI